MIEDKPRWGVLFLVLACALIGGLYYLYTVFPVTAYRDFYEKTLPVAGLLLSLLTLFSAQVSYPRLHSVRVYFLAYGMGAIGTLFFTFSHPVTVLHEKMGPAPQGFAELLAVVALVNLCAVSFFPAATKYRVLRSVTLCAMAVEIITLCVIRFGAGAPAAAAFFYPDTMTEPLFWAVPALVCAAVAFSVWKLRHEFFLGGIVAGCALPLLAAWGSAASGHASTVPFQVVLFAAMALYLPACLLVHGIMRMEHRIAFDPLLKIYNRDYCSRIITEQANLNVTPPFAVAMVDIDHFKQVNDTYGHQAGDAVLHAVAQAAKRGAGAESIACRYGGEELALFFPQRSAKEAAAIGERIRTDIEKIKTRSGRKTIKVTISIGVSHRETFNQSIVDVIAAADKALYAAKKGGRNQVRCQKTSASPAGK